jgi:hypothetical protein
MAAGLNARSIAAIPAPATVGRLRRDFPAFWIWTEIARGRTRYIARRRDGGTGLHTVVTGQLTELRTVLDAHAEPARGAQP